MKIGLVCPYNIFKGGGVQECVLALQTELSKRGHTVLIVSPQPRENGKSAPDFVRLLGRATDVKSPFHTTAQVSVSVEPNAVDRLLEQENFDILHFHEPWVPLLSRQLLQKSQAKNVATFHAKLPDTVMSRTIEKVITPYTGSVLKYLHGLTAVSETAAAYVRSLTDQPVQIVPNGIDLKKYQIARKTAKPEDIIFFIGRLERRKGLKYLIRAVQKLQTTKPHVRLVVAGDGPDRQQLERYAKEHDVHVQFLGQINEVAKLRLFHRASVFCSPARYGESFGIVLLEAMACGLPTVAGDNPGYASVLQGTGQLSLVDPRNTAEFARKLDLMMSDQAIRQAWQDWAAHTVEQYNYPHIVDQYEAIYQK